jgi:hypothetical protein
VFDPEKSNETTMSNSLTSIDHITTNGDGGSNGHIPADSPSTRSADPMAALEALAVALEENAAEERLLAQRVRELAQSRRENPSWHAVLAVEDDPSTVQLMSRVLGRLSLASGTVRRSLVLALRDEGVSIPAIARLFGVTHQRVSNLLRGSAARHAH